MSHCSSPGCSALAQCRCSVCKTLYCSRRCQESHWPAHWRDCLPVPDLEPIEGCTECPGASKDHDNKIKHQESAFPSADTSKRPDEEIEAFVSFFETPSSGVFMLPSSNVNKLTLSKSPVLIRVKKPRRAYCINTFQRQICLREAVTGLRYSFKQNL